MAAVPGPVPQLHAAHLVRRGGRVAARQGVEHGGLVGVPHRAERCRRTAPGGQGRERDERAQVDDEGDGPGATRRHRGRDPGRRTRRGRRRIARRGRPGAGRRPHHRGERAADRRIGADRRERSRREGRERRRGRAPRSRRSDEHGVHEHAGHPRQRHRDRHRDRRRHGARQDLRHAHGNRKGAVAAHEGAQHVEPVDRRRGGAHDDRHVRAGSLPRHRVGRCCSSARYRSPSRRSPKRSRRSRR